MKQRRGDCCGPEASKKDLRGQESYGHVRRRERLFQATRVKVGKETARLIREWLWNLQKRMKLACPGLSRGR